MENWTRADANWHRLVDLFVIFIVLFSAWSLSSCGLTRPIIIAIVALVVLASIGAWQGVVAQNNATRCENTRRAALRLLRVQLQHVSTLAILAADDQNGTSRLHDRRRDAIRQFIRSAGEWDMTGEEMLTALTESDVDVRILSDVVLLQERDGAWPNPKPPWMAALVGEVLNGRMKIWGDDAIVDFRRSLAASNANLPDDMPTDPGKRH